MMVKYILDDYNNIVNPFNDIFKHYLYLSKQGFKFCISYDISILEI